MIVESGHSTESLQKWLLQRLLRLGCCYSDQTKHDLQLTLSSCLRDDCLPFLFPDTGTQQFSQLLTRVLRTPPPSVCQAIVWFA